jgi:F-type H+-transporting ATPase subunit gamma
MQITSAMKMVSAAKLKKAQDAITAMRPYSNKLTELLQSLSATLDADSGSQYSEQRIVNKVLIVAITSNRGLCGAFNSNIIKQVSALMDDTYNGKEISVLAIGKKANDAFSKKGIVIANESDVFDDLTFENVSGIAQMIMDKFVDGEFDRVDLVYNSFKNAATQIVMSEQFLPIQPVEEDVNTNLDYIFEPSKRKL